LYSLFYVGCRVTLTARHFGREKRPSTCSDGRLCQWQAIRVGLCVLASMDGDALRLGM